MWDSHSARVSSAAVCGCQVVTGRCTCERVCLVLRAVWLCCVGLLRAERVRWVRAAPKREVCQPCSREPPGRARAGSAGGLAGRAGLRLRRARSPSARPGAACAGERTPGRRVMPCAIGRVCRAWRTRTRGAARCATWRCASATRCQRACRVSCRGWTCRTRSARGPRTPTLALAPAKSEAAAPQQWWRRFGCWTSVGLCFGRGPAAVSGMVPRHCPGG